MRTLPLPLLLLLPACGHESEVIISNPAITGRVSTTPILRHHRWAEGANGLPGGAMDDGAMMTSYDRDRICFAVTLHEVNRRIPLAGMVARMSTVPAPEGPAPKAVIENDAAAAKTYEWTTLHHRYLGSGATCVAANAWGRCMQWSTQSYYQTYSVPGSSNVFRSSAQFCFPNTLQRTSKQIGLELYRGGDLYREFWWGFPGSE